ncbi:MAG: NADH-quinone oxidoreductase subunit NuoH [Bacteroidetes bacterium]|nr:NADH-quinone oxidoreductase subunit NuoH [Bacteroidota bacterium]
MEPIIFKIILVAIMFLISLGIAAYSTYAERKVAAFLQDRIGPDRAGPYGLLQPIADGVKMFLKEEIIPNVSDKWLFILGPSMFMVTALMTSAIIPWGRPMEFGGVTYNLQVADINIGILYIMGVLSLGVYGIMIGGWASNNKYALLGAIRASSQMISYELAMGMSIISILLLTDGSLSLNAIVDGQKGWNWNILYQPVGFIIFLVCAFAEANRTPFDLPESESELIGGYHTEYSSMKLGLFLFAEYINMFISSAIISTLYFGGYNFPGLDYLATVLPTNVVSLISVGALFTKIFFFIFVFMWVRWTIPRFRYDQLMRLGWQVLLPLAILNMLVTGGILTFFNS